MTQQYLPNTLKSTDRLQTVSGMTVGIVVTRNEDEFGDTLYRLKFESGMIGNGLYSRDELQNAGCRLI